MSHSNRYTTNRAAEAKRSSSLWRLPACIALLSGLSACETPSKTQAEANYQQGKALFEERCKNVAGEKIYRTVSDVEGVLLLKVPPKAGESEWQDPDWPGAAFAHERSGGIEGYVQSLLWWEQEEVRDGKSYPSRGSVNTSVTPYAGYHYVDAVDAQSGIRYRYTLAKQVRPTSKIGWVDTVLIKTPTTAAAPRYGVTYEDHINPAERSLGVASTTVKVVDTQTGEVLGEYTRFVWTAPFTLEGARSSSANPTPWLPARKCGGHSTFHSTRFFVDQVLIPKKEK